MNVLVAGGAGFIGSHLVDALLADGNRVICVDNLYLGTMRNIEHLRNEPNFVFYEEDLNNIEILEKIFFKEKINYVYHLAANSDIRASSENPAIEFNYTFATTFNILNCMKKYDVKKLFFSSTSAVYGENLKGDLSEISGPLEPISYYGASKLSSEAYINAFSHMNDISSLIFRFPNVIGPRLTHGVIYDFIKKLKNNKSELEILGDGTQRKPYLHVKDLINGIMMLKDKNEKGVNIFNIGVDTLTTVTDIANIICEEMKLKDVSYNYTGGKIGWKGDVPTFKYNLNKIYGTGWKPEYNSDEAVKVTAKEVLKDESSYNGRW